MSKKVVCSFKPEEKKPINCGLATNFTFKVPENYDPLQQVDKEVVADIAETIGTTKKQVSKLTFEDIEYQNAA